MTRVPPRTLVAAWEFLRGRAVDVFRPGVLPTLATLPGWTALGLPAGAGDGEAGVTLLDALRALALRDRKFAGAAAVDLVGTLPASDRSLLATPDVVRTLIESARTSILVVGFEITEPTVKGMLFRRGMDGVEVTVVGDRQRGSAREILKDWPAAARPVRALENVEPASQIQSFLHAKVIVSDEHTALVGSANFTAGGLRNNLELGVRITGSGPSEIVRLVGRLEREGWLVAAAV